jgi:hypothetical protein
VRRILCIPLWLLTLTVGAVAQPGRTEVGAALDTADVIIWRQVKRSDFRGDRPPGAFGTGPVRPVAVSCAYVVANPAARIYPVPVTGAEADVAYTAQVEGLSFHALLSRSCSWWNPATGISPAYVLQHEQLHFDMFEVAARRLNRDLPGLLEVMEVRGPTVQSVVDGAQRYVQAALARSLDETAKRNRRFDLETSYGFQLQRQASWRMTLDRDLKNLKVHAAPIYELTPAALGR